MLLESKIWIFTDLDDTLFQTASKLPAGISTTVAALDRQGEPASFATQQQLALLNVFLKGGATVIPVTGRNQPAFERHILGQNIFGSFRILSHGAIIVDQAGELYQPWVEHLNQCFDLKKWEARLEKMNHWISRQIETHRIPVRTRVIAEHGISAYVSIKSDKTEDPENTFHSLRKALSGLPEFQDIRVHINGNNMALMAPYTCKAKAVRYLMNDLGIDKNDLVLGLGDSLTDLPFLRETHFGLFPMSSQIDKGMQ